ncbi:C40 family peptidase [Terrisporobacter sp.]
MKTKIITAIGIGTVALSLGQSSVSAQEKGTVIASALNVRSGPGLNYNTKGCLYKGDTTAILDESNGWLKIQLSNGTTGWVSKKYIEIGSISVNAKVNCSTNLNVRSGPSTSYSIKTTVSNGTVYKILQKSNGWYKIELSNGVAGWVSGYYIKETTDKVSINSSNNNTSNLDSTTETEVNKNGKVTSSVNLNVRSGPGTSYSKKSSLKPGEVVFLLTSSNGWYKVKLKNEITGWVSGDYIKITDELVGSGTSGSVNNNTNNNTSNDEKTDAVIKLAMSHLNKPYVWGANGPNSFDCSGFTRYVYLHAVGVSLPRVSYDQAKSGKAVSVSNLKEGDLLHFATVEPGRTSHVGIYIGNNQFIHASGSLKNPDKVKISSLSGYYKNVLLGARRIY